jgi:hypothetical protein
MGYESLSRHPALPDPGDRRDRVLDHVGDAAALLHRHRAQARLALRGGPAGARALAPRLLARIADPRTLRTAWDGLARDGGPAPGPNGLRPDDLCGHEAWELCRALGKAIRAGTYRVGPERVVWVPKGAGRGERPIVLQDVEDRVVQRAALSILQPVLDPLFEGHSYGFRPGRGRWHALAEAERLTLGGGYGAWVSDDVRDAFQHVPLARLLQVVGSYLPADDLLGFLGQVLPGRHFPGLRQGGPLSPLLLNLYLHHLVDRPWGRDHPDLPLLRYADDLLLLGRDEVLARNAHDDLARRLRSAGMGLKGTAADAVRVPGRDAAVEWLGFEVTRSDAGLAYGFTEASWGRLADTLGQAHAAADAPLRAVGTVKGWLAAQGPCYAWCDRDAVIRRVEALARDQAFDELPARRVLLGWWRRAHDRWDEFREVMGGRAANPTRVPNGVSAAVGGVAPGPVSSTSGTTPRTTAGQEVLADDAAV